MFLFSISGKNLKSVNEMPFELEHDMQKITEHNLEEVFGLQFVTSEFSLNNFRVDTLAYDEESKAFVIIEYKKDKNFSVIDQGYAYLSLMLNNQADFILEYNEKKEGNLTKRNVDWSQSRVIFVSPTFTTYQTEAINFKDLPIELWEIKRYENGMMVYNKLETRGSTESIGKISKRNKSIEKVSKKVKVYTEDDFLKNTSDEIRELYEKYKEVILNIGDDIKINPTKVYIAFQAKKNICSVFLQTKKLKFWINAKKGELNDPKKLTRDVSNIGHHGIGDYELHVPNSDNFDYIIGLIKQSYDHK